MFLCNYEKLFKIICGNMKNGVDVSKFYMMVLQLLSYFDFSDTFEHVTYFTMHNEHVFRVSPVRSEFPIIIGN